MSSWDLLLFLACSAAACTRPSGALSAPPDVSAVLGVDPEVVRLVDGARARVLAAPADVEARRSLARLLDANALDEAAVTAWEQVLALDPSDERAGYLLARAREDTGDPTGALEALEACLARASDYAPAQARYGRLLFESGREADAEAAFRRTVELESDSARGALGLARVHLSRDEPREVLRLLEPVVARNPRELRAHGLLARAWTRLGDAQRAAEHLAADERADLASGTDPWAEEVDRHAAGMLARIDRAKGRLARGDARGALAEVEPLRERLDELPAVEILCEVHLALGEPAEVLRLLEQDASSVADAYRLIVYRGRALHALGELEAALATADRAREVNPRRAEVHALRGNVLFDLGRDAEAVDAFLEARREGDEGLGTALQLGRAVSATGRFEDAIAVFDEAAERFPLAPKPWAYRAECLALLARAAEGRASLAEAVRRGLPAELIELVGGRLDEIELAQAGESRE